MVMARGRDRHGYVLADRSRRLHTDEWVSRAVALYHDFRADKIVAERNYGGGMVEHTISTVDPGVPVQMASATRGKVVRAQPIAAIYEQGRVNHVGRLALLEIQLTAWTEDSGTSPDRLDARLWGLTDVFGQSGAMAQREALREHEGERQLAGVNAPPAAPPGDPGATL